MRAALIISWAGSAILSHSMRKLCLVAAPCSLAIFLSVYLFPESWLIPAGLFCTLSICFSFFLHGKARTKYILAAIGLSIGFMWTSCYGYLFRTPALSLIEEGETELSFIVIDFPTKTSRGASFTARVQTDSGFQPKVQLYAASDALEFRPGDTISATVVFSSSALIRGETVDYFPAKGIYLFGYVRGQATLLNRPEFISLVSAPRWIAKTLKDRIIQNSPNDISGFLVALITGDKSFLPTGLYASFQRSGIAHVVAVSGLHIGFLAGLCSLLLGKQNPLSAGLSIFLIFLYIALTGGSPSALRAAFMTSLLLLAPLAKRETDPPTTLSTALLLLLLPCPYAISSVSLQLSFAAVAGIYLVTPPLFSHWSELLPKWHSLPGKLAYKLLIFCCATLSTTIGALLFTTPLAAFHFGSVSLVGPFTNLLILWAVPVLFLGGLATAFLSLIFTPLGVVCAEIIAWPARWVTGIAHTISRWPFTSISLLSGYLVGWFFIVCIIIFLWLFSRKKVRPLIPVSVLCITLCSALLTNAWPAISCSLTVAILDVGQGASTLFYSKGYSVLVDCGGNQYDDAGDIAADFLQALGTSHLDTLILTHYHSDHADGVPELLARLDISLLILPDITPEEPLRQEILSLAETYGCEVILLSSDSHITFGAAQMEIFAPLGSGTANEEGLSVLCSTAEYDVLITGDMDSTIEHRLVKYKSLPDIELLVVGHHGSKTSTSEEFLMSTSPEAAVISVGYNSYGHPTAETLARLSTAGCNIYRTDLMGTIIFTIKGALS